MKTHEQQFAANIVHPSFVARVAMCCTRVQLVEDTHCSLVRDVVKLAFSDTNLTHFFPYDEHASHTPLLLAVSSVQEMAGDDDEDVGTFYSESESENEGNAVTAGVTRAVCLWNGGDVAQWVASLGPPCNIYWSAFKEHVINESIIGVNHYFDHIPKRKKEQNTGN